MSVVVGYIPTPQGKVALDRAVDEAKLRRTKLVVVGSHKGGDDFARDGEKFETALRDVEDDLKRRGVDFEVHGIVQGNDPADDLIAAAEAHDASLIVIGLRKRSALGKLVRGSNAQEVLLNAPCDVLAVKVA